MLMTLWGASGSHRVKAVVALLVTLSVIWPLVEGDLLHWYGSQSALVRTQDARGFRLVGTLGQPVWPALVVARNAGQGGVEFVTAGGQPHRYQGFSGPMKALHFRGTAAGQGFTLVFHQPPKPPGVPPVSPR